MEKNYPKYSKNNTENGWNNQGEYILYITLPLNWQFHYIFVNSTSLDNYCPRTRFYPYLVKTTRYLNKTKKIEFGISRCTSPENFRYISNEIMIL